MPLYVIVDAIVDDGVERQLRLLAYHDTPAGYREIAPDARGWVWLAPVRLWLALTKERRLGYDRVVCYDENGNELGDYTAITKALELEQEARAKAEARAVLEAEACEQAERRLAAEVEARANAERQATAVAAQAAAAIEAKMQAERRIRELEAKLAQLPQVPLKAKSSPMKARTAT